METGLNTHWREHLDVRTRQMVGHAENYRDEWSEAFLSGHHGFMLVAMLASLADEMAQRIEFLERQQKAG